MKVIIIRGLPGSGKSTFAKSLLQPGFRHIEADMYFESASGYGYRPEAIKEAHAWCESQARAALEGGESVIVANTFSRRWEYESYLKLAAQFGASVEVITCKGEYQNIHNVPASAIQAMRDRWEEHETEKFHPAHVLHR